MADQSTGASGSQPGASGTPPGSNPIEELINRIRDTLGGLTPEPLLNRLTPILEEFLSQFQLLPVRDFETHLKSLAELEATVDQLEERIRTLEQAESASHS